LRLHRLFTPARSGKYDFIPASPGPPSRTKGRINNIYVSAYTEISDRKHGNRRHHSWKYPITGSWQFDWLCAIAYSRT
jgi:hypothetical protein